MLTMHERAQAYRTAFPQYPASWPWVDVEQKREVLYAIWQIGNDYRNKTRYYGAYPNGYLARVMALFPDVLGAETLHVFSGSVPVGDYIRCDISQDCELPGSVYDLPTIVGGPAFRLILADPPYSEEDAEKYQTPMVNRGKVFRALAEIAHPGAFCVWLDTVWPMHSKTQWVTVGRIPIIRSTNHRVRLCSIFERV